jgi:hypothetical protein
MRHKEITFTTGDKRGTRRGHFGYLVFVPLFKLVFFVSSPVRHVSAKAMAEADRRRQAARAALSKDSMNRRHRLQVHLQQEADKILRTGRSSILNRNTGKGGACRDIVKAQARAKVDAKRGKAEAIFRSMPKEQRKVLTDRFKAQRIAGILTRTSWLDWLFRELENDHGLSLQRTTAGPDPRS